MAELAFDTDAHEYRVDGRRVPSVTQVLEVLEDFSSIPAAALEAARDFGSNFHIAANLEVRGELDHAELDDQLRPYVAGLRRFLDESGAVVLCAEQPVYCAKHRYAGTLDAVVEWHGRRCLIDWKSGVLPRTVGPQTVAYAVALGEPRIKRYCIQITPDDYAVHPLRDPADWSLFVSCLNVYRFRNQR